MKNHKNICTLLCLCLSVMVLAGCVAAEAVKPESASESTVELGTGECITKISSNESAVTSAESAYEWDFQKGWPVYAGDCVDTGEDLCWPYGDGEWFNTTATFAAIGEELLFHVELIDDLAEKEDGVYAIDTEQPKLGGLLQSLGIPYEIHQLESPRLAYKNGKEGYLYEAYHMNLSRADAVKLAEYMVEAGVREEDTLTNMFRFCHCGDLCGATNTASPEIPENWAALAWEFSPIFEENKE